MKKLLIISVLISMVAFLFTGCMCAAEQITERAIEKAAEAEGQDVDIDMDEGSISIKGEDGEEIQIDSDSEEMTIKTEEGETKYSAGGADLPEGFPSIVPIHPDINIASSSTFTQNEKKAFAVTGTFEGDGEEIFNWYKGELSSLTIDSEQSFDFGEDGSSYSISANDGTYNVAIIINESEDSNGVIINVEEK